jgi:hypothetical protein
MADYRLRNHIPISGPATREPCTGDEPFLRVSLGFTPRWYHARLGIDFAERWHTDPVHRYETLVAAKEHLYRCFPQVPYFAPRYRDDGVEATCATISAVHGIMLIPMLYGLEPVYRADGWPDAAGGRHVSREALQHLRPIDPAAHPVVRQLLGQMDEIERRWGPIHGYLNYQGILNVATKVRGQEIFLDMVDEPDWARRFFGHVAAAIGATSRLVQARQRRSGFAVNLLSMSNCVMNMVSPQQYRELVLPFDRELSLQYERFGVHTCNWDATPYLEPLREIEKMGYLDTGISADLARIRRMFPDARRAIMYGPVALERKSLAEIRGDLQRVAREYAPCDIVMADVESTTPDDRVRDFLDLADELSREAAAG